MDSWYISPGELWLLQDADELLKYWGLLLEMERFRSLKLWTVDGISGVGKLSRSFIFLEFLSSGGLFRKDSTP